MSSTLRTMTLAEAAARLGDKPALITADERISYTALDRRTNQAARVLRARGVGPGAIVGVALRNRPEFMEAMQAVWRLGGVMVPISYRAPADELQYLIDDAKLAVLVCEDDSSAVGNPVALRLGEYLAARQGEADSPVRDPSAPMPEFSMPYTSGTTGRPKALRFRDHPSGYQATSNSTQYLPFFGVAGPDEIHLCLAPLYHSQPRTFLRSALAVGHTAILMRGFDAEETLRLIEAHRVSWVSMAPIHFVRILDLPDATRRRYDLSSIRCILHSAAPVTVEVKRAIIDLFPSDSLWEMYGGTEGRISMISAAEWLKKPGSVGRSAAGRRIEIRSPEGRVLPAGEVGMIYAASDGGEPLPRFEYQGAADATADAWSGESFTLGEVGYLDEDGYLFITDRVKDMIVTGGVNVYCAEVENVLAAHAAVSDCAVIGVPDREFGERVLAIVQRRSPVDEAELIAFCRDRIADYKCPRAIDFVEALPRDPAGKLRKRELRKQYAEKPAATG